MYVNIIWRNIDWSIGIFAANCIIYREIANKMYRKIAEVSENLGVMGGGRWY
jgi:hypothetical protein